MGALPSGFEDLEPFVGNWALEGAQARFKQRYESDMGAITSFYEAMMPRAEDIMAALETQPLDAMSGPWLTLYRLMMSLPHVAVAVERHGSPRPASAVYPTNLKILQSSIPE